MQQIFKSDKPYDIGNKIAKVYKKGTYENVKLMWGYDYAEVTFKKDTTNYVVATQYIAKRAITFADYVGIDFLFNNNKLVFNEIENVVGARMVYSLTNIDIGDLFIKYIDSEI